jgi:Uma2 family endonuclease
MVTVEDAVIMGINAPKAHQRVISKLNTELGILFYKKRKIALEPLPETMIDEGQTSPVPDILLYDNKRERTPVIIEIAHPNGVQNDILKLRRLIDDNDYGVIEGFVYDYKNKRWFKYEKSVGDVLLKPSFCKMLNLDLNKLI